jgi:YcxB-like protein
VQQETTTVELQYTKQDYVGAQKLHRRLSIRAKWVCGLVVISSAAVALILQAAPSPAWYHSWAPFFAFVPIGSLIYYYCLIWFYARFVAAWTFKRHPILQLPKRLTFTAEGIRYESDRGASTLLWRDFIKWRSDGKLILAYLSPRLFVMFPARLATAGFPMARLKEKLTEQLGPAKG